MAFFWLILGVIVGFFIAWFYLNRQCEAQLADRDSDISRLELELAALKAKPGPAAQLSSSPDPAGSKAGSGKTEGSGVADSPFNKSDTTNPAPASGASASPAPISGQNSLLDAESLNTEADDLTRIKGIGKVLEEKLRKLGIVTFQQIADFTTSDVARVSEQLDFPGRIEREKWVEQAKAFAGRQTPS